MYMCVETIYELLKTVHFGSLSKSSERYSKTVAPEDDDPKKIVKRV